jgi:hypothetical protein
MAARNSTLALLALVATLMPPCYADTAGATGATSITATQIDDIPAPPPATTPAETQPATPASKPPDSNKKTSTTLNPPSSAASLQGNVQGGAPVVLQGLHDVGTTVHHLQEMLKGLLFEAQRQDMVVVAEPNVIGPMVIPAIPNPSGMMSIGYLPPRKKWIDYFMSQIEEIIPMLDHEINSLPRPDQNDTALLQAYTEMFDAARGFNPPWAELETATKGPEYKNKDISFAGSDLWFQIEKFKKLKDKLFKMVKEEAKQKKKKES